MKNGEYNIIVAPDNYPGKKYRNRYCYEHIFIWWKNTGNIPSDGNVIHHINGNKRDNRINNLKEISAKEHNSKHSSTGLTMAREICSFCGNVIIREKRLFWKRKNYYCNRFCMAQGFKKRLSSSSVRTDAC